MTFEVISLEWLVSTSLWPWCNIVPFQRVYACRRYHTGLAFTNVFCCLYKVMQESASCHFYNEKKN